MGTPHFPFARIKSPLIKPLASLGCAEVERVWPMVAGARIVARPDSHQMDDD
jgi:hypothetical protein